MSKKGLEPSWIAPYAPETYVSTIPPLRHFVCKNFLLSCQISAMLYVLSGGVTSGVTLSENDTQSFSCGRVPLRHFVCKNFLLSCQIIAMLYVLSGGVASRATLSENDTQSFSCGRVPLRHFVCKFFDNLLNCCHDFFSYVISAK